MNQQILAGTGVKCNCESSVSNFIMLELVSVKVLEYTRSMEKEQEQAQKQANGFDMLRKCLRDEYDETVSKIFGENKDSYVLKIYQARFESIIMKVDIGEASVRDFYFRHGYIVAGELIEAALDVGATDEQIVTVLTQKCSITAPELPPADEFFESSILRYDLGEIPFLGEDEALNETTRGVNYRIAEHLGIF